MVKRFIADLHSGKLHREFHHGPDSSENMIDSEVLLLAFNNNNKCGLYTTYLRI